MAAAGSGRNSKGGKKNGEKAAPPGLAAMRQGQELLGKHAGFQHIKIGAVCGDPDCPAAPRDGLVLVDSVGSLHANVWNRADKETWAWALAHARLHLGFGHLAAPADAIPQAVPATPAVPAAPAVSPEPDAALRAARCTVVNRFLRGFKVGTPPFAEADEWPDGDEETLAAAWRVSGIPERFTTCGTAGSDLDHVDISALAQVNPRFQYPASTMRTNWTELFSAQLTQAIAETIERAANRGERRKGP